MNTPSRILGAGILTLAAVLLTWQTALSQDKAKEKKDSAEDAIAVQERGPLHEAYAQPTKKNPEPTPVVPKQPPKPINEEPPDQKPKGENVQWIPGYWAWDTDKKDYIWVSGLWRVPPPERKWVPGYWSKADKGYQWVPGYWAAESEVQPEYLPVPPESVESGPSAPAPDENSFYIPGCWVYRSRGYLWRPGFWSPLHRNWVWNYPYYSWSPAGAVYVDGYWDYPLADRGLLYAPVYFTSPIYATPGFFFRPRFVVNPFFSSLFLPPFSTSFFFGSSFASPFFFPSFFPSPFFSPSFFSFNFFFFHHHHHNFFDPAFTRGTFPRVDPPLNRTAQTASLRGVSPVTPVNQFRSNTMQLTKVAGPQLAAARSTAQQVRQASVTRSQRESSFAALGGPSPGRVQSSFGTQQRSFYSGPGTGQSSGSANTFRGERISPSSSGPAMRSFSAQPRGGYSAPAPSFRGGGGGGGGHFGGGGGGGGRGGGGGGGHGGGGHGGGHR